MAENTTREKNHDTSPPLYTIRLTGQFLAISALICITVAFTVGSLARVILIDQPATKRNHATPIAAGDVKEDIHEATLPTPLLLEGKTIPTIIYTAKHFDTSMAATTSSQFLEKQDTKTANPTDIPYEDKDSKTTAEAEELTCGGSESGGKCSRTAISDESEHLPAGQHLLIDISNVSYSFLNSEVRLAQAMIDVVNQSKLTLLSYHCHSLIPVGVSCVGVLLESHVSFHTWPVEGVITLDLFTCGSGELVPVLPNIRELFAIPREATGDGDVNEVPTVKWVHVLRGFRDGEKGNYLSTELGRDFLGDMGYTLKEKMASTKTDFQHIDIYNLVHPNFVSHESYLKSVDNNEVETYYSTHPELFRPNRIVFLDGVVQSTLYGLEAYHEALVHPAMFAHPYPRRVAIIGGGEAATLKEVLKHESVELVKMIEIDEDMVQTSREHLPEWSDCSDLIGSSGGWCGDDERAEMMYEDAMAWFIDRFGDDKVDNGELKEDPFDILIMDALDPQDNVPFADVLYDNEAFLRTLYDALSDNGIIVLQLGMAPNLNSPAEEFSIDSRRDLLTQSMARIGFKSLHTYEEGACGFDAPWAFLVAMKDSSQRANWNRGVAELDYQVYARMKETHSGAPALKFFDSNTMQRYKIPNKSHETVFCRKNPVPESCNIFNARSNRIDFPIENFEVKEATVGNNGGRGLFPMVDIKEGSTLGLWENLKYVRINSRSIELLEWHNYYNPEFKLGRVLDYIYGYGWSANHGANSEDYFVDSGIFAFINHGCDGSFNIESKQSSLHMHYMEGLRLTERNALSEHYNKWFPGREIFDPYMDRHYLHHNAYHPIAMRDIAAGEEILDNYVFHTENEDVWYDYTQYLQRICDGKEDGEVKIFEERRMRRGEVFGGNDEGRRR